MKSSQTVHITGPAVQLCCGSHSYIHVRPSTGKTGQRALPRVQVTIRVPMHGIMDMQLDRAAFGKFLAACERLLRFVPEEEA